ncbi:MAG: ABC transporter ATP-binding protein [Actinobacteria bacterium]|nr:ABC transporter ATP-binding protein [Actinomycetota bacterium]
MTAAAAILRLDAVSKSYESPGGTTIVLAGADLTVERGEKVSLMGPSGSGKSTLLSLISGLLRPDAGTVELDGVSIAALGDGERAALRGGCIGIALQSENLIPFLSAIENVDLALGFGRRRNGKRGRGKQLLDQLGVVHRADHLPRQLSGGEAQRVALAVALANEPALLLADEMVSALDSATASRIVDDVFGSEMAVLFVTHDAALADRADRRLMLHEQKVISR